MCNNEVKTSQQIFLDSMRTEAKKKDERKKGNDTIDLLDDSLNVSNNNK